MKQEQPLAQSRRALRSANWPSRLSFQHLINMHVRAAWHQARSVRGLVEASADAPGQFRNLLVVLPVSSSSDLKA